MKVKIPGLSSSDDGSDPEYSSLRLHGEGEDSTEEGEEEEDEEEEEEEVFHDDGADNDDDNGNDGRGNDEEEGGFVRPPAGARRKAPPGNNNNNGRSSSSRRRRSPAGGQRQQLDQADNRSGSVVCMLWVLLMAVLLAAVVGLLMVRHRQFYTEALDLAHNRTPDFDDTKKNSDHLDEEEDQDNSSSREHHGHVHTDDGDDDSGAVPTKTEVKKHSYTVHYDAMPPNWDPFDLTSTTKKEQQPPQQWFDDPSGFLPWLKTTHGASNQDDAAAAGGGAYLMQPDLVNDTLVFVTEGDLYLTRLSSSQKNAYGQGAVVLPAWKLTTTMGNVRSPRLHPTLPLVAFTATYAKRREVYLYDLRHSNSQQQQQSGAAAAGASGVQRLTFWGDGGYGVSDVVGWKDESTLVIAAPSTAVSLPDMRLYELTLATKTTTTATETPMPPSAPTTTTLAAHPSPLEITPVPLSQALNGVHDDDHPECLYFTRFRQNSHTIRYVGGTAESLWVYCHGQQLALPLTGDYNGTSKDPQFYRHHPGEVAHLLFMSDRQWNAATQSWYPTTMNLWALPLPNDPNDWWNDNGRPPPQPMVLTQIGCDFEGRSLQEFSVDPQTGNAILRVGADLYTLTLHQIETRLSSSLFENSDNNNGNNPTPSSLPKPHRLDIHVYSDFHETQERLIPLDIAKHLKTLDVLELPGSGTPAAVLTVRGQAWVTPTLPGANQPQTYQGSGQVMPERTYRLAPGSLTGGALRILAARSVPLPKKKKNGKGTTKRMAVILATDPLSPTAEHAFYLVESQGSAINVFNDLSHLPKPFLGGGVSGGLGSIHGEDVVVSSCGRRLAWTDTDGRICVMNLPLYDDNNTSTTTDTRSSSVAYTVLPQENELGEPMLGIDALLRWSPGGRYLAVQHLASNQFYIISIVDCGDPGHNITAVSAAEMQSGSGGVQVGRVAQVTPSRFNSIEPTWGKARADDALDEYRQQVAEIHGASGDDEQQQQGPSTTTLYFLTDRDIATDTSSPWGTRMPLPHFTPTKLLYALPLVSVYNESLPIARFSQGSAVMEVVAERLMELDNQLEQVQKAKKAQSNSSEEEGGPSGNDDEEDDSVVFPQDPVIDFGGKDLIFARSAYRIANVPEGDYIGILSQTQDGSFVLVSSVGSDVGLDIFEANGDDGFDETFLPIPKLKFFETSTCRNYVVLACTDGVVQVVANQVPDIKDAADHADGASIGLTDSNQIALSVWPELEYKQMFNDAWRMLRDYFYDKNMHQVDWEEVHGRYLPLVQRCNKREELDDILSQMAAELSALHVFVYGGEYNSPFDGNEQLEKFHEPASLGASLQRVAQWKGYNITEIAFRDPDYNQIEGKGVYSPLSDQALVPSGQRGLQVGDVIVGVNGESVFRVPDIHMLLRGRAGRSVRLDVLRLSSGSSSNSDMATTQVEASPEPVIVVPIAQEAALDLRYTAWEYRTQQKAKALAREAGFSVGYVHLPSMSRPDMDTFARAYFEDYKKDAFILDLRHNRGGSIDSWISAFFQRKPWSYFGGRTGRTTGRDMDWNQHFAFRGHLVLLIDEKTSSDGEGISRSISELGLGFLIGKRTWGGGIWLASDNRLVDDGIATAPEDGVYNDQWGWGMGIEQQGVAPDLEVDNNPRTAFDGIDTQLETAIQVLKKKLETDPIPEVKLPPQKPDMSLKNARCV